ncbi:MAG: hypothetical protein H6R01_1171 [Burkholderiaceae bacterium]|nr:hypothetical protein [Burkholderiaceae bacterium]
MNKRNHQSTVSCRHQCGAAVVELAIIIVVMMLIVAGVIGFGRFFWYADTLTKATRDAARLMSESVVTDLSGSATSAKNMVVNAAAASNLPAITTDSVIIECDNSSQSNPSYSFGSCINNTAPANVRVRISGYSVNVAEWFPFLDANGLMPIGTVSWSNIGLAPQTTMRYMK